jgi:hypothetical protein
MIAVAWPVLQADPPDHDPAFINVDALWRAMHFSHRPSALNHFRWVGERRLIRLHRARPGRLKLYSHLRYEFEDMQSTTHARSVS